MKKYFYIFCFILLGIILQQIIHTVIELAIIKLLVRDFDRYGLGLSWNNWFMIHHIAGSLLFILGAGSGYWAGNYFWPKLYDRNGKVRYPKPWRI